jgi:hypothetical protein
MPAISTRTYALVTKLQKSSQEVTMKIADKNSNASRLTGLALMSATGAFGLGCGGGVDVNGTIIDTYVWEGGEATVLRSSDDTAIAALVIDSDGDSEAFEGEVHEDGSFHIPGVPEGSYYLRISAPGGTSASGSLGSFYWTSERAIESGVTIPQRPDAKAATISPTKLEFDVGGLSPFYDGDSVLLHASGANLDTLLHTFPMEAGPDILPMNMAALGNLIDGSKGDRAYITHLTSRGTESFPYRSVATALKAEPFTLPDGGAVTVSGSLEDVPQQTVSIDWRYSSFKAAVDEPVEWEYASLKIAHRGRLSTLLEAESTFQDVAADVTFGNPFPSEWELVARAEAHLTLFPGLGGSRTIAIRCTIPISGVDPIVLAPDVRAVTNIKLNNTSASRILSWDAPGADGPVYYQIRVERDEANLGSIYTPETSAAIPDILVAGGGQYRFTVRMFQGVLDLTKRGASHSTCSAETPSEWITLAGAE